MAEVADMANGQQLGKISLARFKAWVSERSDADFASIVVRHRGVLSRTAIAEGCGFKSSVLYQNPRVIEALLKLENGLRERGVLPEAAEGPSGGNSATEVQPEQEPTPISPTQLQRARSETHSVEEAELRRRLARYELMHNALASIGRVPR